MVDPDPTPLPPARSTSRSMARRLALGVDGISDFNALHSREDDHEVQFCASIFSKKGGVDLRMLVRKTNLERLMARRPEGVFVNPSSASA